MKYKKNKYGDENGNVVSFWSTDDNVLCEDGKTLRENLDEVDTQFKDIANENTEIKNTMNMKTDNIQQQVNNLVLGAVGDGNNAEVVQARGDYNVLGERLNALQNGSGINFETGKIIETLEEIQVKTANRESTSAWVPANAPFYYIDNSCFKEKYITKLTLKFNTIGSVFTLGFKNVNDYGKKSFRKCTHARNGSSSYGSKR